MEQEKEEGKFEGYIVEKREFGVSVSMKPKTEAFFRAVQTANLREIERLAAAGVNASMPNLMECERTALHLAAMAEKKEVIRLLCRLGADLEAKNEWGMTPAMDAFLGSKFGAGKLLIELGASVENADKSGRNVFDFALASESSEEEKLEMGRWFEERFELTALQQELLKEIEAPQEARKRDRLQGIGAFLSSKEIEFVQKNEREVRFAKGGSNFRTFETVTVEERLALLDEIAVEKARFFDPETIAMAKEKIIEEA